MRNYLQIIQSALGESNLEKILKDDSKKLYYFFYCKTELPEKFKGLPRVWYFGVLPELNLSNNSFTKCKEEIIEEAREIINSSLKHKKLPLVIACDDIRLHLSDVLNFDNEPVFFLDKANLVGKDFAPKDIKESPVLKAVKNKFDNNEMLQYFTPYTPNIPVTDWRFFGRKDELKEVVESHSNYFIVGSRKVGKTSLLQETRRQLENDGQRVYWIASQNADGIQQVYDELSRNLSERETYQAMKSSKAINSDFLTTIIKKLKAKQPTENRRITLIFDELGNVLSKYGRDAWRFMGTLRELSHNKDVRIIISAFQEVFIKQYNDFDSPYVNFGTTLKIRSFTKSEIDDILINPLSIWGVIKSKSELNNIIRNYFGGHPLILQYLGSYLFKRLFINERKSVDALVQELIHGNLDIFENAVDEIFKIDNSYLERYIFLKTCILFTNKEELTTQIMKQSTVELILEEIGIASSLDERIFLLDRLTLRGLLTQDHNANSNYSIAAPIVFYYLKRHGGNIDHLVNDLLKEIRKSGMVELNFLIST